MQHRYFKIYKPYGYLSQFITNERPRKKKKLLGELGNFPEETMSVGRLDQDSEGLLFLTTDGKASAEVTGNKIEKEYYVQVDGQITQEAIEKIQLGVEISINGKSYKTLPCEAFILDERPEFPERAKKIRDERHGPTSWISITLVEGKFRQVKKMTAAVGFPTLRLVRVRIGNEKLDKMNAGEVIELSAFSY
ncbi:pseudouridine synthase [Salegentibacter salarius]|uniref:Pseudouridine synthase n=1 Tax=Salegentibacter salarius TaxID=435906 RepID=A0A2N0U5C9_9FLAO|nr:pseudouridine synthase [Salegentibacter salarius]OEY73887.1 ribulose phosphate epimerase [Salegentibacter salarius]PKD22088.1 ribulose phosphate epimerase [Salegentibacter salarius]SLJ86472.1 23S rRNA pseudouridine2457 synthase [Salegentibacter salarius]